jgi:hypothetical protein
VWSGDAAESGFAALKRVREVRSRTRSAPAGASKTSTRLPSRIRQDADGRFASDPSLRLRVTLVMLDKDAL